MSTERDLHWNEAENWSAHLRTFTPSHWDTQAVDFFIVFIMKVIFSGDSLEKEIKN